MYRVVLLVVFLLTGPFCGAVSVTDSLLKELKHARNDHQRIKLLDDLSWQYCNTDPAQAIVYGQQQLLLAGKLGSVAMQANAYNNIGNACLLSSRYDSSAASFSRTLSIKESLKDTKGLAGVPNNLALVYQQQNNLPLRYPIISRR